MNERIIKVIASVGLFLGGIFGLFGSFTPSPSIRGIAWGIDGLCLVVASAILTIYYFRNGSDITAAGYLVFAIGQGLILSTPGINLKEDLSSFGAGVSLWAVSLFIISIQKTYPTLIRITGVLAGVLFLIVSVQIFAGKELTPLSKPLPFYVYPIFVITLFGWIGTLLRKHSLSVK